MSEDDLRVTVFDHQSVPVDPERLSAVARRTAAAAGAIGELSIELVNPGRIAELNERYMGKAGPTDVLSFPVDGLVTAPEQAPEPGPEGDQAGPPMNDGSPLPQGAPPIVIGEVVLCPEHAAAATTSLEPHLDLLVAHGVLHLLGYDHDTEPAAEEMRAAEKAATGRSGARAY